jgi:hypothetical protein
MVDYFKRIKIWLTGVYEYRPSDKSSGRKTVCLAAFALAEGFMRFSKKIEG